MSSSYRQGLEYWLKTIDVEAENVLDIGGSQNPTKGRTNTWNVKNYKIADLKKPHVNSPKPDIIIDMNEEVDFYDEYDVIFCLEVFEYVWNPVAAFDNIYDLLAENGIAYVSFPFVYPMHEPIDDDSLRYTLPGIERLANFSGLKIAKITTRIPETDLLLQFYSAERMRPAKGVDHNVMGWFAEFTR